MENHYIILGISINATEKEIKKAYHKLAIQYHPDKCTTNLYNEKYFLDIQKAYETLMDPHKKAAYDRELFQNNETTFQFSTLTDFNNWLFRKSLPSIERKPEYFLKLYRDELNNYETAKANMLDKKNFKVEFLVKLKELSEYKRIQKSREKVDYDLLATLDYNNSSQVYESFLKQKDNFFSDQIEIDINSITKSWERLEKTRNKTLNNDNKSNFLYDLESLNQDDLIQLYECFEPENTQNLNLSILPFSKYNRKILLENLERFLPEKTLEFELREDDKNSSVKKCQMCQKSFNKLLFRYKYSCVICHRYFCTDCLISIILPQHNSINKLNNVCVQCEKNIVKKYYMKRWIHKAAILYKNNEVQASLACLNFAYKYHNYFSDEIDKSFKVFLDELDNFVNICIGYLCLIEKNIRLENHSIVNLKLCVAEFLEKHLEIIKGEVNLLNYFTTLKIAIDLTMQAENVVRTTKEGYIQEKKKMQVLKQSLDSMLKETLIEKQKWLENTSKEKFNKLISFIENFDLDGLFDKINEIENFDKEVTICVKNLFIKETVAFNNNDIQKDIFMLVRGIYRIKSNQNDVHIGWDEVSKCFWNNSMRGSVFSIDFQQVYVILSRYHLKGFLKVYDHFYNSVMEEIQDQNSKYIENIIHEQCTINWPNRSVVDYDNEFLKIYENKCFDYYKSGKWSAKQVAFAYIDLISGCEMIFEIIVCYISSAMWLLKEIIDKSNVLSAKEIYALKECIFILTCLAEYQAFVQNEPVIQYYVCRLSLAIELYTNRFINISKENLSQIVLSYKRILIAQKYIPILNPPTITVFETAIFKIIYARTVLPFLEVMVHLRENNCFLETAELCYKVYEKRIFDTDIALDAYNAAKLITMNCLIKENKSNWNEVLSSLNASYVNIDDDGWFVNEKKIKETEDNQTKLYNFRGFEIDLKTGKVNIFASKRTKILGEAGNFSWDDVEVALKMDENDLPIYFSLEQPDNREQKYHPFQKFLYHPPMLKGSQFLKTLFHTDYIMKQWSIGDEINHKAPFEQRKAELKTLFNNVPENFAKNVLKSTNERGEESRVAHRFWIQAESIDYEINETEKKFQVYVGEVKMKVKTHELVRDNYGNLVDSNNDIDPNSPAAKFAQDLTENFDKICQYYPEFERLKSLCKLQVIPRVLTKKFLKTLIDKYTELSNQTYYNNEQKQKIEEFGVAANNLTEFFNKYRKNKAIIERSSYEYVPAVLHRQIEKQYVFIIYGGVSLNCNMNEKKGLRQQKWIEKRNEVSLKSITRNNPVITSNNTPEVPSLLEITSIQFNTKGSYRGYFTNISRWQCSRNQPQYLYHYTSKENFEKIKQQGVLKMNNPDPIFGHPAAVYLTELVFDADSSKNMSKEQFNEALAYNNYGNAGKKFLSDSTDKNRFGVVIRIPVDKLPSGAYKKIFKRCSKKGVMKNEFTVYQDINLADIIDLDKDVVERNQENSDFE